MIDIDGFKEFLADTFGTGKDKQLISEASQEKIDAIVKYVEDEQDVIAVPGSVEVFGARMAVERVEAYGLEIGVDAIGNAVHITSSNGFHTDGA